jgi:hypothetical protein
LCVIVSQRNHSLDGIGNKMILEYFTKLCFGLLCFALVTSSTPTDEEDVCTLPKDAGRCRGLKPSFYFNTENK